MRQVIWAVGLCLPVLSQAQLGLQGEVEAGLFIHQHTDLKEGERVLLRNDQPIEPTRSIPARLGSKFGVRFSLAGKQQGDQPLTFLYLTPGVIDAQGQRLDRFEVQQALQPHTRHEVMAFEFSEQGEVVPGQWRFLVFQGPRKLLEEHFEVR